MGKGTGDSVDNTLLPSKQQLLQKQFTDTYQEIQALKQVLKGYLHKEDNNTASSADVSSSEAVACNPCPHEKSAGQFKFKPSKTSERILAQSQQGKVPFLERVKLQAHKHEQTAKSLKEQVLAVEDVQMTFTPSINPKSKRMERRIDHLWSWERDKQVKVEARRIAAVQDELAQVTPVPVCSAKSNQMLQRCSSYTKHSAARPIKVEDRLQRYGATISAKKKARRREPPCPFQPTLSCHSARLQRDGDVHTRLFNLAAKEPPPQPSITAMPHRRPPPTTPLDAHTAQLCTRLHEEATVNQEKLKHIRAAEARDLDMLRNTPKISATSLKLARQHHTSGRKAPTSPPPPPPKQPVRTMPLKEAEQVYLKQVQWKVQKEAKATQEREAQQQHQIAQCTFSNPYRTEDEEQCPVKPQPNDTYFRKAMDWERRRQQLVAEKQQRLLLDALKECTFHPHTNPSPQDQQREAKRSTLESMLSMFRHEQDENCLRTPPKQVTDEPTCTQTLGGVPRYTPYPHPM
ncbi:hypothetical protein, variant [Aphanomyces astaci]|uniref:Uncharacterized protein n=1 Tax=Aphanomyces astaci TaxID=112090 RepID=W4FLQ9_APHAT|nr:hypothetical protein, variant [Aphanomyces astaci]ETV67608.1 hypothetical protein, variant [Aphanomyces astaci]|eukprot:XP_009842864.1 hypothetical protein, variant [Aphanomyces astaci]